MTDSVSELIARIIDNFGSSALREINWICGVKDELQRIKETLVSINAVLLDAQDQQSTSKSTKLWLQNLKFVAYDIEDVFDLISTQDLELRVNGRSLIRRINRLFTNYDVARELKVIRQKLDEIEYNRRSFNFRERRSIPLLTGTALQRETYSCVRQKDVIGREEDKDRIVSVVVGSSGCDADCLSVVPIVAIGGMGKTTLAKLVFNDHKVIAGFELRLWVHVSNKFVLKSLIVTILQSATSVDFSNLNMELLQNKLCEKLGGRNFVLILDDVWISDPKEWVELKTLLAVGAPSSKIIVTTREERVASVTGTMEGYKLNNLSDDHCWSIFAKYAFNEGEEEAYPSLVRIGKSIVHKCCGVPLAAKTLGSALRHVRDDQAWKKIEGSELWKIVQGPNDILPALKLSYDQTPNHIRSLFASCAVLRKGCSFFRVDLINTWMALGLLHSSEGCEDAEVIGDRNFNELLSRSFLQPPSYAMTKEFLTRYGEVFDEKSPWKGLAHMFKKNLIKDMDLVAHTFLDIDEKKTYVEMHDLLHDLATYVSEEEVAIVNSQKQAISANARHILWDHEDLSTIAFPVHLSHASKARVFAFVHPMGYVSKPFLKGLLSNLKCLRILNLDYSEFEELPSSVGELKHLRYLSLCWNLKLTALPQSTCKLVNLQSLYLFRCIQLKTFPKDIHKLVSLRFWDLTSKVSSFPDGSLSGLRSLRLLRLWYSPCLTSLPEDIGSLMNLRRFEILGCPSITTLPNEMKCLTNLETLKILYCRSLDLKGWEGLHGLRNLKYLDLGDLPKLMVFPEGFGSIADSLRCLRIRGLRALPEGLQHCTSLSNLTLSNCPKLTTIPRFIHALKSLKQLNIDGCPEIRRRCEKDTGSDWHLISHIPIIRIDHQVIQSRAPSTQDTRFASIAKSSKSELPQLSKGDQVHLDFCVQDYLEP